MSKFTLQHRLRHHFQKIFKLRRRTQPPHQPPHQPPGLCQACMSVLASDVKIEKLYPHHTDLKDFIEASQIKCYICSWLFTHLPASSQENLLLLARGNISDRASASKRAFNQSSLVRAELLDNIRNGAIERKWYEGVSWASFTSMKVENHSEHYLSVSVLLNPFYEDYFPSTTWFSDSWLRDLWATVKNGMRLLKGEFMIIAQDVVDLGLIATELSSNTDSMETWTTIAGWFQQCTGHHQCLSRIDLSWYPTRLVERISSNSFRVIRSDSASFDAKRGYITLSHRWGDDEFVKLTKDNLSALQRGSPVATLRKSFQDAMVVAERLGIAYVWIDSLCIIQSGDNGEDWRRESMTMAQVYSNSYCNISADWGDEFGGLFFKRTPIFEPPYKVSLDGGDCYVTRARGWSENLMESPLNRRGWVLQERLLAPRVLHFSPQQVSWECGQKFAWEKMPMGFDDSGDPASSYGLNECVQTCEAMRRLKLHEPDAAVNWPSLVQDYTVCGLTEQSDRLIAVAGIAKVLASTVKDQYVAGIWAETLPRSLVWKRAGGRVRGSTTSYDIPPWEKTPLLYLREHNIAKQSCSRKKHYYAPSFSWAAADGAVEFPGLHCFSNQDCASATFIKYREKMLSSATDNAAGAEFCDQILTHHVFGPMTSPEVEIRIQGVLRSCRSEWVKHFSKRRYPNVEICAYPSTSVELNLSTNGGQSPSTDNDDNISTDGEDNSSTDDEDNPSTDSQDDPSGNIENAPKTNMETSLVYRDFAHIFLDSKDDTPFPVTYDRTAEEDAETCTELYYYTIISCDPSDDQSLSSVSPGYYGARGIFLKSVDASMGRFERIGYLEHWPAPSGRDLRKPLGNEKELPAWNYDDTTGQHTFYIV